MKNMTLENIEKACGGRYIGTEAEKKTEVLGVVIDSRQVESGYLFVAIPGEKVDGHKFIPDVFAKGAAAVLSEQQLEDPAGPYILVESTTKALRDLAEYYRKSLDIKVVGITGSVGKTRDDRIRAFREIQGLKDRRKLQQRDRTSAHNL